MSQSLLLPLFNPAIEKLDEAYDLIEALEIQRAHSRLREYLKVFPSDIEVTHALSSLQWLMRLRPSQGDLTEEDLFRWWRKIEKDAAKFEIVDTELYRHLKHGILTRLTAMMAGAGKKKVRGVHLGLLYFELGDFRQSIRELEHAVGESPYSSALWGPLAEALYRTGRRKQAGNLYGLALLYEPQKCGLADFSQPDISAVQAKLVQIGMTPQLARENLLVQCWLDGCLALPALPSVMALHHLLEKAHEIEPAALGHGRLALQEDAVLFRWCLQICEWVRQHAVPLPDEVSWAQAQMKARDARAYEVYQERLRLESLQDEETLEFHLRTSSQA